MALETGTYIADLVATNPISGDPVGQGDDHLRLIKSVLLASLPNLGNRLARNISTSAGYTLLSTDNTGVLNVPVATGATITHTVSLPAVSSVTAGFFADLHVPGPTDIALLVPTGGASIEGSATFSFGPQSGGRVFYDGTTWRVHQYPIMAPGTSDLALAGTLSLSGAAVMKTTLTVEGATTLSGAAVLLGTLQVGGTTSFSSTVVMDNLLDLQNGQIKFPASMNASANANTLDDYEEGTWTPSINAGVTGDLNPTYATQIGLYTKIGRMVQIQCTIEASDMTHTTASGTMSVDGLPFSVSTTQSTVGALVTGSGLTYSSGTSPTAVATGSALIFITGGSSQAKNTMAITDHTSGTALDIWANLTYTS